MLKISLHQAIELFGWYGIIAILIAYAGTSFEAFSVHSLPYLLLNLSGSIGVLWNASTKKDWPASVLNGIWALIALVQLFRL
ncbi:hypothetical protein KBA73_05635 [Patescibacteria group bacterium]|nr:hypothetical protein [Patescibacteria group bacterium]